MFFFIVLAPGQLLKIIRILNWLKIIPPLNINMLLYNSLMLPPLNDNIILRG